MGIELLKMKNNTRCVIFLAIVCVLLVFISFPPSQDKSQKPRDATLQHEVSVTLKLVQVFVTDKNGNPLKDLTPSDFEIYDNNKLQPLYHFEKHVISQPGQAKPAPAPPERPPTISRKFFLFFDFVFNGPRGAAKAKKAGLRFIDTVLQLDDEVGVLSFSTTKELTVHEYLTTNHHKIRQVVEELGLKQVTGRAEQLNDLFNLRGSTDEEKATLEEARASKIGIYNTQVLLYSRALKELAKALRYIPGTKNIIFFSSGIARLSLYGSEYVDMPEDPYKDAARIQQYSQALEVAHGNAGLRDEYKKAMEELKASNCPVYAVNVAEPNVELGFEDQEAINIRKRDAVGDDSLKQLSNETGGKYYSSSMDYKKVMDDVKNLTSAYYVLGYSIDEKWNGKFHKIKVEVKRPGCRVYGQAGYFSSKPFAEYTEYEKQLHLIDLALSENPQFQNPIEFPLITLPLSIRGKSQVVALSQLSSEMVKNTLGQDLEIVAIVFDAQNNVRVLQTGQVNPIDLSQEKIYPYSILLLPPGNYSLRLVLRNKETGRGARASSTVVVPQAAEANLRLFPLLLLTGEQNAEYIPVSTFISLYDAYPYNSALYSPLVNETHAGLSRLFAVARCSVPEPEPTPLMLSSFLADLKTEERKPVPLTILSQSQESNTVTFFLELQTGELKPGKYVLYLFASAKDSARKTYTATDFSVN
jgi:VWFA-related protein